MEKCRGAQELDCVFVGLEKGYDQYQEWRGREAREDGAGYV